MMLRQMQSAGMDCNYSLHMSFMFQQTSLAFGRQDAKQVMSADVAKDVFCEVAPLMDTRQHGGGEVATLLAASHRYW